MKERPALGRGGSVSAWFQRSDHARPRPSQGKRRQSTRGGPDRRASSARGCAQWSRVAVCDGKRYVAFFMSLSGTRVGGIGQTEKPGPRLFVAPARHPNGRSEPGNVTGESLFCGDCPHSAPFTGRFAGHEEGGSGGTCAGYHEIPGFCRFLATTFIDLLFAEVHCGQQGCVARSGAWFDVQLKAPVDTKFPRICERNTSTETGATMFSGVFENFDDFPGFIFFGWIFFEIERDVIHFWRVF